MTENQTNMLINLYDHQYEPPADFLEECRLYWANHKKIRTEKEKATPIYYIIEPDGTTYFYHGSTRIKVTEHFKDRGQPITALMEDVIQYAAQN